jgi:hypothetical protein
MTLKGLLIGIIACGRDDPERIPNRDNNMWKREVDWAHNHGITTMRCPCVKCPGGG